MNTFSEVSAISPVPAQPFIWMAEYFSGGLTEFDLDNGKENAFKDIEKEKLVRFGLIGNNKKMWYECQGGTFHIAGRNISVAFETKDGKRYGLAGNGGEQMRDIITYKRACAELPVKASIKSASQRKSGILESKIDAYYYGYKTQMSVDGVKFNFKPIVALPMGKAAYMEVSIMSDTDLDGRIVFIKNGQDIEAFEGKLEKDRPVRINWLIK